MQTSPHLLCVPAQLPPEIRIRNPYIVQGALTTIIIRRRSGQTLHALVDTDVFYTRIAPIPVSWCAMANATGNLYAYAKDYSNRPRGQAGGGKTIYLHRVALGLRADDPREVDHRNFSGLDNRLANLRAVTHKENQQRKRLSHTPYRHNRSGLRNIRLTPSGKFQVSVAGRYYGLFVHLADATRAAAKARGAVNLQHLVTDHVSEVVQ